jgi:hypothetical protein
MLNIFLENCVRSAEYECTKQASKFHEEREQIDSALPKYSGPAF